MDAVLISATICALFVLATLIERAVFATMRWILAEPLPEFELTANVHSIDVTDADADRSVFVRSSLPA
jgi:hypothetical protein